MEGSTLNKKICGTDINMKLGVCALEGCKQCNVFTLTIGPMSFRLDGDSLNELVAMLRQCANSKQYEENLVESFNYTFQVRFIYKHISCLASTVTAYNT